MSVASKNLFALLDDDAQDSPPAANQKKEAEPASTTTTKKPQNQGKGPASRGGRYYQRGAKSSNPTSGGASENVDEAATDVRKKRDGDQRGRGRGGRGGRGRGRGGGRGREFDRHSGALPDSEKRVHQGWGGDDAQRELQNETSAAVDATVESTGANNDWAGETTTANDWAGGDGQASGWDAPAATEAAPAADAKDAETRRRRFQEEEEDDNTLTLEQYLAKKKQTSTDLPKLEGLRKANEGSDDSLWKNAVQNGKDDDEEHYFVGKGKAAPKSRAKKAEKEFIEIEARFERPGRGGRGRGRGSDDRRGRGGRGGRGGNNSNRRNAEVDVADQAAFPSLS